MTPEFEASSSDCDREEASVNLQSFRREEEQTIR